MNVHLTPSSFVRSTCPQNTDDAAGYFIASFAVRMYQDSGHVITPNSFLMPELEFNGRYVLYGTVKKNGVAGAYQVRLFEQHGGRCIRSAWSSALGFYAFERLADKEYFVIAFDHAANPKNAQIADHQRPELMA